jgi:hypothetical protein
MSAPQKKANARQVTRSSAEKYQPLAIEIVQNGGHHYRQIWRDDHAAVYEQRNPFGAFIGYEAIAIKRQEPCRVFGRQYPAKEIYPCSEHWGKLAISVSDFDRAMDAAREFSKRREKRLLETAQKGADSSRIAQGRAAAGDAATADTAKHKVNEPKPIHE